MEAPIMALTSVALSLLVAVLILIGVLALTGLLDLKIIAITGIAILGVGLLLSLVTLREPTHTYVMHARESHDRSSAQASVESWDQYASEEVTGTHLPAQVFSQNDEWENAKHVSQGTLDTSTPPTSIMTSKLKQIGHGEMSGKRLSFTETDANPLDWSEPAWLKSHQHGTNILVTQRFSTIDEAAAQMRLLIIQHYQRLFEKHPEITGVHPRFQLPAPNIDRHTNLLWLGISQESAVIKMPINVGSLDTSVYQIAVLLHPDETMLSANTLKILNVREKFVDRLMKSLQRPRGPIGSVYSFFLVVTIGLAVSWFILRKKAECYSEAAG